MKDTKTKYKKLEPCPLCGSEIVAMETSRLIAPEINPWTTEWVGQARFKAYCENCFLTQDVMQSFPLEDKKLWKATAKEFFLERENLWNRRKVEKDC